MGLITNLLNSSLSNRKYRTKINSYFSEWKHFLIGVPQGSEKKFDVQRKSESLILFECSTITTSKLIVVNLMSV